MRLVWPQHDAKWVFKLLFFNDYWHINTYIVKFVITLTYLFFFFFINVLWIKSHLTKVKGHDKKIIVLILITSMVNVSIFLLQFLKKYM